MYENKFKLIEVLIKNKFPEINILGWEKRVIGSGSGTYYVVKLDLSGTEYEKDEFYNDFDELGDYLDSLIKFTNVRFLPEYITSNDLTN